MREKIDKYNAILRDLYELLPHIPFSFENEEEACANATNAIRELRQIIERLRRVVGESDTDEPPRSLTDMNKLKKDELAFVAWQFWEWISEERCPANKCTDFPCQYRQKVENDYANNYSEEDFKKYKERGFDADKWCNEDQIGCWAEYYLWCYRNGYDPLNGKKEAK